MLAEVQDDAAVPQGRSHYSARMWKARALIVAVLLINVGPPQGQRIQPIVPERLTIVSTPITIAPAEPTRTRVGALKLLGGWRLTSSSRQFGGWSALALDGDRFTAIGDAGSVLRFRLGAFGNAYDATIKPMPGGCGATDDKRWRDTESVAHDPASGDWWVGYEWRNAICRVDAGFNNSHGIAAPDAMKRWPRTRGAESMTRLKDGRFVVLSEGDPDHGDTRPLLVFDRDPTDPAAVVTSAAYRPTPGYDPTDIEQLPDGRLLVLERRFGVPSLFTSIIAVVDAVDLRAGAVLVPRPLARLESPTLHDNFEGMAVTAAGGRTVVWIISDDNFLDWQATYLLKFVIDPGALAVPAPTGTGAK